MMRQRYVQFLLTHVGVIMQTSLVMFHEICTVRCDDKLAIVDCGGGPIDNRGSLQEGENMKAASILVPAIIASSFLFAGCEETYSLRFTNVTSEPVNVRVLQDGRWDRGHALVPADGGKNRVEIKQDSDDNLAYIVATDREQSQPFPINKRSPKKMYFRISPNGISGPTDSEARVDESWDRQVEEVPIQRGIKIQ
jgi:hypothetical protein